jgi:hypothetical protein
VVEQGYCLRAKLRHRVAPHVARLVGVAMPQKVDGDHPVPALGQRLSERAVHEPGQHQARKEQKRARAAAVLVVDEPMAVVHELACPNAHQRSSRITTQPGDTEPVAQEGDTRGPI